MIDVEIRCSRRQCDDEVTIPEDDAPSDPSEYVCAACVREDERRRAEHERRECEGDALRLESSE